MRGAGGLLQGEVEAEGNAPCKRGQPHLCAQFSGFRVCTGQDNAASQRFTADS